MRFCELERGDVVVDLDDRSTHAWVVLNVMHEESFKVKIEWLNLKTGELLISRYIEDLIGVGFSVLRGHEEMHA